MDEGTKPFNPPATSRPDVLHDQQLLRDIAAVNTRTQVELGPLHSSGLPIASKRKPKPWWPIGPEVPAHSNPEDEVMKLSHVAATAALGIAGMQAGCSPDGTVQETNAAAHQDARPAAQATTQSVSKTTVPNQSKAGVAMSTAHHRELLERIGGTCKYPDKWDGCMAGDYDLELIPGCAANGFFAGVSNEQGALLLDKAPPDDKVKLATLSKGQFVCIEAIARSGQDPAYYLVTAVPVTTVEGCADNPLCMQYGDREIRWHSGAARQTCTDESGAGRPQGDCVSGWVDAVDLDVFSNGL